MHVVVIGGGAAGVTTAYLLDRTHRVTLLEREPALGGHVRTLTANVRADLRGQVPTLDAGVIEFERGAFPLVHRLFEDLDVALAPVPGTTTLFLEGEERLYSMGAVADAGLGLTERTRKMGRMLRTAQAYHHFYRSTEGLDAAELSGRRLSDFVDDDVFGRWCRLLLMYAWSTRYADTGDLPAVMAVPTLRHFLGDNAWTRIPGGVYTYIERMIRRMRGRVVTGARVRSVRREPDGVRIDLGGELLQADMVVFATPPDQVLALLADPTDAERARFGAWEANHVSTLVHWDDGPYQRRGEEFQTEFDLFWRTGHGGYNAGLNRLCGVPAWDGRRFGLAFDLDDEIDPARVVHRQAHHTPRYTVAAVASREAILATNGDRRTWFAGAWLGDGLHEGAIASAVRVSEALGGRTL